MWLVHNATEHHVYHHWWVMDRQWLRIVQLHQRKLHRHQNVIDLLWRVFDARLVLLEVSGWFLCML